ncbi:zinc finger protein 596-like [Lynx pardinus]|uniref:Zinc finger protein 596-like n=1 Tax=Lynx pardinus TaxID=191816 RepID=A0A485MK38_LYNPA|nr:zinc finger protein 596-like [Lynx pardinus]
MARPKIIIGGLCKSEGGGSVSEGYQRFRFSSEGRMGGQGLSSLSPKQKSHSPEDPFECDDLEEDFTRSVLSTQHLLTHTEKTPQTSTEEICVCDIHAAKPSVSGLTTDDMREVTGRYCPS